MKNYKSNHKRNRYRHSGDRNFKRNGSIQKLNSDFTNGSDFRRKNPGKNNQNASKLIDKYSDLAKEALSNGDKILYENYLQHADHFARISEQQLNNKLINANKNEDKDPSSKSINTEKDTAENQDLKIAEN